MGEGGSTEGGGGEGEREIGGGWTNDPSKGTGHPSLLCDIANIFWSFCVKAHTEEKPVSVLRKEIKDIECFLIKFKRLKMFVFRGQTRGIESSE